MGCGERQNKKGKVVLMEKSDMPYIYMVDEIIISWAVFVSYSPEPVNMLV